MLSEELDVCEFTLKIGEQSMPFNWMYIISGLVTILLIIIIIIAIKIKRNG